MVIVSPVYYFASSYCNIYFNIGKIYDVFISCMCTNVALFSNLCDGFRTSLWPYQPKVLSKLLVPSRCESGSFART